MRQEAELVRKELRPSRIGERLRQGVGPLGEGASVLSGRGPIKLRGRIFCRESRRGLGGKSPENAPEVLARENALCGEER